MAALPPGSVAVLTAADPIFMAGIVPYRYRQGADFLYLTGVNQPGAMAVLESAPAASGRGPEVDFTLLLRPRVSKRGPIMSLLR